MSFNTFAFKVQNNNGTVGFAKFEVYPEGRRPFFAEGPNDRATMYVWHTGDSKLNITHMPIEHARAAWLAGMEAGGVRVDPKCDSFKDELQVARCNAGLCDHYTCTEGEALFEWEYNNGHR